jgi:hypothetical protein
MSRTAEALPPSWPPGHRQYVGDTDLTAVGRLDRSTLMRAAIAAEQVRAVGQTAPPGWPIGLESNLLEIAWPDLSVAIDCRDYLREMGIPYAPGALRPEILDRPPSELGLVSLFQAMGEGPLRRPDVARAVRLMGIEAAWRTSPARTTRFSSGHYTEFADPVRCERRLDRLLESITKAGPAESALVRGTHAYFAMGLYHPLQDGNGRAARALFQCVLKADLGIAVPLFPLGPLMERNKRPLLNAKSAWYWDSDANPLVRFVTEATIAYCDFYEAEWSRGGVTAA